MTVMDAVHWEYDGAGGLMPRASALPVAPRAAVLAGVAHLDGFGTVVLPAPPQVAEGVAYGPEGAWTGVLSAASAPELPVFTITPAGRATVFTCSESEEGSVHTLWLAAPGGAWRAAGVVEGDGSLSLDLAPGPWLAHIVTAKDGGAAYGPPTGFYAGAEVEGWERLRAALRARLAALGDLLGAGGLHVRGLGAPRELPALSFEIAPAPGSVPAAGWFEARMRLWFTAERAARLDACADRVDALFSGWRLAESPWDARGFRLEKSADDAAATGPGGAPALERALVYAFRARKTLPAPEKEDGGEGGGEDTQAP